MGSAEGAGHRDRVHARPRGAAGLHRRALRGRPRRDARRGDAAGRQPGPDQSADPVRAGDRPLGAGRRVRPSGRARPQRQDRVRAQQGALQLPALGPEGVPQLQGGAAQHRHRAPGEPRASRARGGRARSGRRAAGVPGHRVRYRLAHHHDQRHRRARLGRRRHRGGSGDARPALVDADSAGGRLQADRPAAGGLHRHRPRAHRHPDAAQARRGRKVRRVLRRRPAAPAAGRPRHHRQHGARVRRHLRHLPDRRRGAELPAPVQPSGGADRAGRGLRQGAGPVVRARPGGSAVLRGAASRPRRRQAVAGRPEAPAGPRAAAGRAGQRARRDRRPHRQAHAEGGGRDHGRRGRRAAAGRAPGRPSDLEAAHPGPGLRAHRRLGGDRRDHLLHQHLQPGGDAGRRPARAQRRAAGPEGQAVGEDLARTGLAGGHRLPEEGRRARRSGEARLLRGRLRLHHLHRQLRPAARRGLARDRRERPRGRLGAVGQPQLRGPRAPRSEDELPRLAAAGGRLRDRGHGRHRPEQGSAGAHARRQAGLPARHLAQQQGDRRRHRRDHRPGDVRQELRRRVQGRHPLEPDRIAGGRIVRVGRLVDLHQEPALFRRHEHERRHHRRRARRARAGSVRRLDHHRPHLPGRQHQEGLAGGPLPDLARRAAGRLQQLRLAPRQRRRDGARHLRQHPHQEPDAGRRGRRQHDLLRQGRLAREAGDL